MTVATRPGKDATPPMDLPSNVVKPDFRRNSDPGVTGNSTAAPSRRNLTLARSTAPATSPTLGAHIPLPGKVWNLAHRRAWQNTLTQMSRMESLVLLVELPPASMPEAVLLAESLPQVIWLADSGRSRSRETREQIQTLRHAKCRLVGAVLNHEPKPVFEL